MRADGTPVRHFGSAVRERFTIDHRPASRFAAMCVATLVGACLGQVQAQTPPDAGALLNQIRNDPPARRLPEAERLRIAAEPQQTSSGNTVSVTVRSFNFIGDRLVDRAALEALTASWVGKTIGLADLQAIAAGVAEFYRARGWVVRTFLPPQDITDGIVTVQVVEARFGGASVDGRSLSRVTPAQISGIVEHQQAKGAPVDGDAIDRALLLAGDLPGVSVNGSLVAGPEDGETSLAIQATDAPLLQGGAVADNTGSRATGTARASLTAILESLAGGGDQARADLVHTQGSDYLRLAVGVPLGFDGLRAGVNASALHYRLVADEFAPLQASGQSRSIGAELSYPIWRAREANLRVLATLDRKRFVNMANGAVASQYLVYVETIGLDADLADRLGGGGFNTANLTLGTGHLDLDANPVARLDGSGGDYRKLQWSLARRQQISDDLSLFASWRGQWANGNLDSSEKFYLGGANGVRAYPANEAGGSSGHVFTLEVRRHLDQAATLSAFYDNGRIAQYRDDIGANGLPLTGDAPNAYSLSGYGVSLGWYMPFGATVQATWSRRIGANPNPAATGADQDGSLLRNRFWLSASLNF
jgi:hemolysin activation/secretion protein